MTTWVCRDGDWSWLQSWNIAKLKPTKLERALYLFSLSRIKDRPHLALAQFSDTILIQVCIIHSPYPGNNFLAHPAVRNTKHL